MNTWTALICDEISERLITLGMEALLNFDRISSTLIEIEEEEGEFVTLRGRESLERVLAVTATSSLFQKALDVTDERR